VQGWFEQRVGGSAGAAVVEVAHWREGEGNGGVGRVGLGHGPRGSAQGHVIICPEPYFLPEKFYLAGQMTNLLREIEQNQGKQPSFEQKA